MAANNGARMTPTLIVTRPAGQSASFAAAIAALWDAPLRVILSPLLEIVCLAPQMEQPDAVIFTSANGVDAAGSLGLRAGLTAWCVGEKTADVARQAGFDPVTGPGDAAGLTRAILDAAPQGRLAHIRGRHARGDIAATLNNAGLHCADVIAYDQRPLPLTTEAQAALAGTEPVILPLFSPRSATILAEQGPFRAPVYLVAISKGALDGVEGLQVSGFRLAARPDNDAMTKATIAALQDVVATWM